jgi:hypothetical protein
MAMGVVDGFEIVDVDEQDGAPPRPGFVAVRRRVRFEEGATIERSVKAST